MKGHKWRGTWPWQITQSEADRDYVEGCNCAFCRACRDRGHKETTP